MKLSDYIELNPPVVLPKGANMPFVPMGLVQSGNRWVRTSNERPAGGSGSRFLPGDTLFARITPCLENGKIAQYVGDRPAMGSTEFFVLRARDGRSDPGFVYYFSQTKELRSAAEKSMSGASGRQRAALSSLRDFECELPPLRVQQRVAEVLSAYDELIENNQRRVRILEEMAHALYREWFVQFRFPGHEGIRRVASPLGDIPECWELTELAKVCSPANGIQTGPFGSQLHQSDYVYEGVPVVMPRDLVGFRIRTENIAFISEETATRLSRHRMKLGDIVYGRRGDIGRRAYIMPHQAGWFCGTGSLRIRPDSEAVNGWYLFNYLGEDDVVALIAGRAQGVTMPNLNSRVMASVPVRLPPRQLQDDFARMTFPIAEAREKLTAQIDNLRRMRDLLLPRLMSGQVELKTN